MLVTLLKQIQWWYFGDPVQRLTKLLPFTTVFTIKRFDPVVCTKALTWWNTDDKKSNKSPTKSTSQDHEV